MVSNHEWGGLHVWKKLTNNAGAYVADNQNVMTAGPRFCAQKMVRRFSNDPSSLS